MVNAYSIGGFIGAAIVAGVLSMKLQKTTTPTWTLAFKIVIRRVILDAVVLAIPIVLIVIFKDSESAWSIFLGDAAYLAVAWAWTLAVWGFLGIRWIFTNAPDGRVKDDKPGRSALATWRQEDDAGSFEVVFDRMMLIVESTYEGADGETLYYLSTKAEEGWNGGPQNEGWTEAEWKDYRRKECEVRRRADGVWESRLTRRYWERQLKEAQEDLEGDDGPHIAAAATFKNLIGYSWEQWLNRETVPLPEVEHRPWRAITDEITPSIETAYQRYIHQG